MKVWFLDHLSVAQADYENFLVNYCKRDDTTRKWSTLSQSQPSCATGTRKRKRPRSENSLMVPYGDAPKNVSYGWMAVKQKWIEWILSREKPNESALDPEKIVHKAVIPAVKGTVAVNPERERVSKFRAWVERVRAAAKRLDLVGSGPLALERHAVLSAEDTGQIWGRVVVIDIDTDTLARLGDADFVLPSRSSFVLGDVLELSRVVPDLTHGGAARFELIIVDPPWENKSAVRSRQYATLHHRQLLQIPVSDLADVAGGCYVAVWVTNRPLYTDFVIHQLFPRWAARYVATWYWLKMRADGEPVMSLDALHRRPYEPLIIGHISPQARTRHQHVQPSDAPANVEGEAHTVDQVLLMSIPTAHSAKPPLARVFAPYLRPGARTIELFARNLTAGWTSVGDEVLMLQSAPCFIPAAEQHQDARDELGSVSQFIEADESEYRVQTPARS